MKQKPIFIVKGEEYWFILGNIGLCLVFVLSIYFDCCTYLHAKVKIFGKIKILHPSKEYKSLHPFLPIMATSLQLSSVSKGGIVKFIWTVKNRTSFHFVCWLIALATIENTSLEKMTLSRRSCLILKVFWGRKVRDPGK